MVLIINILFSVLSFGLFLIARQMYRQRMAVNGGLLDELEFFRQDFLSLWKNTAKLFIFVALILVLANVPLWSFYFLGKTDANVLVAILTIVYYYYVLKFLFPQKLQISIVSLARKGS